MGIRQSIQWASKRKNAASSDESNSNSSLPCALTEICGVVIGKGVKGVAKSRAFATPMVSLMRPLTGSRAIRGTPTFRIPSKLAETPVTWDAPAPFVIFGSNPTASPELMNTLFEA